MSEGGPSSAPSTWTAPSDVQRDVQRLWDRGLVLAEVAGAASVFPYRVRLRTPKTAELLDRYDDVRRWVRRLAAMADVRLHWQAAGDRTIGRNDVPSQVWVDDLDAACRLIGSSDALARFRRLVELATERVPTLLAWMAARPLDALAVAESWPGLLDVVVWIIEHPRPDIYVRQVDIVGINTKFIEVHRTVLASMLDDVLPANAIDRTVSASVSFARRYGFRAPPTTVTFRLLHGASSVLLDDRSSVPVGDRPITLTIEDFARLTGVEQVFVTENYINFLAFPAVAGAVVVFGQGNDVGKIAQAEWVRRVPVHYWGDIDTYGFAILAHLRSLLPHVLSLLMNRETLLRNVAQWVVEDTPTRRDLSHLCDAEQQLYDDLRDNRLGSRLRLEQELIDYAWVHDAVRASARRGHSRVEPAE